MKNKNILLLEKLLEENLIPYMEVTKYKQDGLDLRIQIYYPKIVKTVCEFLNQKFTLEKKENLLITRNNDGFHFVDVCFILDGSKVKVRLQSMLKYTWGVA
jgi:hypothetical protein